MNKPSKLLREYDAIIENLMTAAKQDKVYVVARIQKHENYRVQWINHQLDETHTSQNTGLGMYVFTLLGHVALGSTNDLSPEAVNELYHQLVEVAFTNEKLGIAKADAIFKLDPQDNLGEDQLHYRSQALTDYDLGALPRAMQRLDDIVTKLDAKASLHIICDIDQEQWRIVRSDGTDVDFAVPKVRLRGARLTVRDKSGTSQATHRAATNTVSEFEKALNNFDAVAPELLKDLHDQIGAPKIESKLSAMLLDSPLVGTMVHEALGHPAEADLIAAGGSVLGDENLQYIAGQKVADAGVNVTDHEADLGHGFHPYGAFGNARLPVSIVKDGKLHESISDIFSAETIGVENKNCERSESYAAPAIPRMSNTYLHVDKYEELPETNGLTLAQQAQETLRQQGVFKDHQSVILMRQMQGGQVNTATGTFMFGTAFTYEITADKITPCQPATFSGDVLSALKSVRFAVGALNNKDFGFCGKSSQRADVSDGGNALVFLAPNEKITVA